MMEIPKEHRGVYQDVKKYGLNKWALELADALRWAVARALEAEHKLTNHFITKFLDGGGVQTEFFRCELCGNKTLADWLAEADKELMKEQPK